MSVPLRPHRRAEFLRRVTPTIAARDMALGESNGCYDPVCRKCRKPLGPVWDP